MIEIEEQTYIGKAIMSAKVLIMMATYNGEKYIAEQIESIISQKYTKWDLIIQDDGSTDRTVEIVERYATADSRIQLWRRPKEVRHGAYYNFHSLINRVRETEPQYDYYMFSDQDDIWFNDKIEQLLKIAEKKDKNVPFLLYADMKVIDDAGQVIMQSMNDSVGIKYNNQNSLFYCHSVSGCNILVNYKLFQLAPAVDVTSDICAIISHDNYFAKLAALTGKVIYLDKVQMSYRRYGENVTAKQEYDYGLKRVLKRIIGVNDLAKDHALTYNQTLFAIKQFRKLNLSEEEIQLLDKVENSLINGGLKGLRIVNSLDVSWGNKVRTASRKIVISLGLYKKYLMSGF